MFLTLTVIGVVTLCLLIVIWIRRTRDRRELELHSITPEALQLLLLSNQPVHVFDVRRPLDLLADPEIISGAMRIPPKEFFDSPSLIPKDKDVVVYCTCSGDKTSRSVSQRALGMHFSRFKFLRGGLAGWKAKGYPVEQYKESFHLETRA